VRTAEAHAREQRSNRGGFGNSLPANSMVSRVSFQGSTTSSARRGAAKATDSDAATHLARRAGRRSGEAKVAVIARRIRKEQLRGCAGRVSAAHVREQRRLSREQENLEVRKGVGIANQSGPVSFFLESTTSSSSYPSPIVRARPQHLKKARQPSYRASSDPFAETSSPWQSRLSSPRITVKNTSPVILHPLQFPASFFVTHEISSPSSSSRRQFCSLREFIFHLFSSTTKATPRFALIH
jgi:hypothetical protein